MNKIILLIVIVVAFICCNELEKQETIDKNEKEKSTQKTKNFADISFINNDSLKYSIEWCICDDTINVHSIYLVNTKLSKVQEKIVKQIDYNTWMQLFNSDTSDWAANLILYDLYQKDGYLLKNMKNKWRLKFKNEDRLFWKNSLPYFLKTFDPSCLKNRN